MSFWLQILKGYSHFAMFWYGMLACSLCTYTLHMHPWVKLLSSSHNHRHKSTNRLPPQASRTLTLLPQAIRTTIDCHHRLHDHYLHFPSSKRCIYYRPVLMHHLSSTFLWFCTPFNIHCCYNNKTFLTVWHLLTHTWHKMTNTHSEKERGSLLICAIHSWLCVEGSSEVFSLEL